MRLAAVTVLFMAFVMLCIEIIPLWLSGCVAVVGAALAFIDLTRKEL